MEENGNLVLCVFGLDKLLELILVFPEHTLDISGCTVTEIRFEETVLYRRCEYTVRCPVSKPWMSLQHSWGHKLIEPF